MNNHNSIDESPAKGYLYKQTSTDIVQEQTVRRLNRDYLEEERKKRESVRAVVMVVLCVGAIVGGFILCKVMGWVEP